MFNKQQFEDKLYAFVTAELNAVFPTLVKSGGDVLKFQRQFMQACHFVLEESTVQNMYGWNMYLHGKESK